MTPRKQPEADLERRRSSFMLMGILCALALTLVAFEWTAFEKSAGDLGQLQMDFLEEEVIPPSATPPPPPPPPPAPTTVLEIVEDEKKIEQVDVIDTEVDQETNVQTFEAPEEKVEEEQIFTIVEKMPTFPGGEKEMFKFLAKVQEYPQMAVDAGIQGTVYVTFVVDKDGKVKDIKVLRGLGGGLDEAAVRMVSKMPPWEPGMQRGKPVKVQYNLPVRFTLK
ncbi:MAG: energy transducer TonB [Flavobacteriales bacterium]|nr:energy transducer TonB [Flavobacteriales bacterium]